jgi:hypothetical protein
MRTSYATIIASLTLLLFAGSLYADSAKSKAKRKSTVSSQAKKKPVRATPTSVAPVVVEMSLDKIMKRVDEQNDADDERSEIQMVIVGKDGKKRERIAILYSKKKSANEDLRLIRFQTPADLAGSGVLTIENTDRDNDQWVYIPAYHTTRRIAAANLGDAYLGTDYSYEDALNPVPEKYSYELLRKETVDNIAYSVIKAVPSEEKLKSQTSYSSIVYWVDTDRFVVLKTVYYDKKGAIFKELANSNLKEYKLKAGTKYRFEHSEMTNLQTNHKTVSDIVQREINGGLSSDLFTERYLKKGANE